MTTLALTLALALGGADSLGKQSLLGLTFKAPTQWGKSQPDANSLTWSDPESGAELAITVYPVDPVRPGFACLKQMVEALGSEGFNAVTLGAQPASKKVTTDYLGEGEESKTDANRVTTTTVIGCNGKTKWVMTWTAKTNQGARFGPILKRVLESIGYGK
jgi:hypothetical protein